MKLGIVDNNKNKTKILDALYIKWKKGYDETNYGRTVTDLGRTISVLELTDVVGLSKSEIEKLMIPLCDDGYTSLFEIDKNENQKNHLYLITDKGKKASIDKHLLNNSADRNRHTIFQVFGIVMGLFGFILALTTFLIQVNSVDPQIEKLQKQIDFIKEDFKKESAPNIR